MRFWNIVKQEGKEPEIRIEGRIYMEQDMWDWFFGAEDRSAPVIRQEIEKLNGQDITVWINSPGGEVFAASVIYTALKEHNGFITVKVDGMACSAASVIAMAGDKVLMSPPSVMMIHNPLTYVEGEAKDMLHAAEVLDEVKETIINAYMTKSSHTRDEISQMMDDETWMGAEKAIQNGFADGMLYQEDGEGAGVTNVATARLVYNSLSHETIDMERLRKAVQAMEKTEQPTNRPQEGGSSLPEDSEQEETTAGKPSDEKPEGMNYADYTLSIIKAQMKGEKT